MNKHQQIHNEQAILQQVITVLWGKVKIRATGNHNTDYGNHYATMNFTLPRQNTTKLKPQARLQAYLNGDLYTEDNSQVLWNGSATYGLVKDKENAVLKSLHHTEDMTEKEYEVLRSIQEWLISKKKSCRKKNTKCMRINIIKGARTIQHLDDFRNTMLPNYFIFFPPCKEGGIVDPDFNFALKVIKWPNFKVSFVLYRGQVCIPFNYKACENNESFRYTNKQQTGGCLKLITYCETTNRAKWLICPPTHIHLLQPYKKMAEGKAVLGIVDGNLRYTTSVYHVFTSFKHIPTIGFKELLEESIVADSKPRRMVEYFHRAYHLYTFYGWRNIHCVDESTTELGLEAIRIHIFFKNIRTVNVAAQARFPNIPGTKSPNIDVIYD